MRARLLHAVWSVVLIFALLGCSSGAESLRFKGETETWEAEFLVTKVSNQFHEEELVLRYIGEEKLGSTIIYEFTTAGGRGKAERPVIGNEKVFKIKSSGNGAVPTQDDTVDVKVEWNGKTEEFKLTH